MASPDRLAGISLKIQRAKAHNKELNEVIKRFQESNPYEVIREEDSQTGDLLYKIRIRRHPPPILGAIFGDIIHNLRSALDHVAVQLVER